MISIYKLYSDKGDKCYIGSSNDIDRRFRTHKCFTTNKRGYTCSSKIVLEAYGVEHCKIEVLEEVEPAVRLEKEEYWIQQYPSAVNRYKKLQLTDEERYNLNRQCKIRYKQQNHDTLRELARERVICECGAEVSSENLTRHKRSVKHITWEEAK